jgi:hypothetical protein
MDRENRIFAVTENVQNFVSGFSSKVKGRDYELLQGRLFTWKD